MRKATKLVYPVSTSRKTTTVIRRTMNQDAWNPEQYERFKNERSQPFFDLLGLVKGRAGMRVLDLGCGTGELTREMHRTLVARETLGLDNSAAMLEESARFAGEGLSFGHGDIAALGHLRPFDLVFSNAALQWLPNHVDLMGRILKLVAPGGQLAVQMPANHDHVSHTLAHEVAARSPYKEALSSYVRQVSVMLPEDYALLLHELGVVKQQVQLRVYGHVLGSTEDVVEWVKGTLLTDYKRRLPEALYADFLEDYRRELLSALGTARPYFYPFKRILLWAQV